MLRFFVYDPDQACLLSPHMKDALGSEHLCFRLHAMVEQFDLRQFEQAYGPEGRLAYPPSMMLKVWLYAFCLGVNSTRRLERRIQEDLAFRYLAGGLIPDHKTLSEFLRRHRRALNDVFTQVVQMARRAGLGKLGHVALDSTRVRAHAARRSVGAVAAAAVEAGSAAGTGISAKGERTRPGGRRRRASEPRATTGAGRAAGSGAAQERSATQVSLTDPESCFLRTAQDWALGYTADLAVSDDHLIVAARVTQNATDNASLASMVEEVERQCGAAPEKVTGDLGFFSGQALQATKQRGIDLYVPDNNLKHEMQTGERARGIGKQRIRDPEHRRRQDAASIDDGRPWWNRRLGY